MIPAIIMISCGRQTETTVPAIDPTDMDLSVAPGEDFYKYSNGGWQVKNPLKAQYARYGSFDALSETNEDRLNNLFSELAELESEKGSEAQKIGDLYKQGMDSTRLNAEGNAPLLKYVREIYALQSKAELVKAIGGMHLAGGTPFFSSSVMADLTDSDTQILYLNQSGLGIGDRDYYFGDSNENIRNAYLDMLVKMFTLTGIQDPDKAARNAMKVETDLAEISWTRVQERDIQAQNNPMSTAKICSEFNGFDFGTYFETIGVPAQEKIIVCQISFFKGFAKLFNSTDLAVLKDYVAGRLIVGASSYLSDKFYEANFNFFSRTMSGITEQKPRWKRATSVPNGILGEAVGKLYVEKYFPESSKNKVLQIVDNLKASLAQHIDDLEWMGEETKSYAKEKLSAITVKIGYPDKWKDYSDLEIDPAKSYYDNLRAARIWSKKDNLSKLGKKTDRTEWEMSPQTVNAYYNPPTNEICFPAAILQPPFFNADADDAVNYGAIGVVIGHEMTHGFDDQGRLFDKVGNMASWWTEEDDKAFTERATKLVEQFNKIQILPDIMANGQLTLGENIADQGGLRIAYTALQNSFGGKHPAKIDGLTAEQRFYIGYAHVWANNITEAEMARRTMQDEHSLGVNRVNAAVRNLGTFFQAFDIKEGDNMFLPEDERVVIW